MNMDRVEFLEKICGIKLFEYQKEALRMFEKVRKEFGKDCKIIMGRKGNVYAVAGKERKIDEKGKGIILYRKST